MKPNDQENPDTLEFLEQTAEKTDALQPALSASLHAALEVTNSQLKRFFLRLFVAAYKLPFVCFLYKIFSQKADYQELSAPHRLSQSLRFYRSTHRHCRHLLKDHQSQKRQRVLLCGVSELAEIASRSARELGMEVVGVYAPGAVEKTFLGKPVWSDWSAVSGFECVMVTDLKQWAKMYDEMRERISADRLMTPNLIGLQAALQ